MGGKGAVLAARRAATSPDAPPAKPTKHTSAELKRKAADAQTNKGGGLAGLADRKGGAAGHAKFQCPVCGQSAPDLKVRSLARSARLSLHTLWQSMSIHHESKHPKLAWEPEKCANLDEVHGGSTQGVAVRGSVKKMHG